MVIFRQVKIQIRIQIKVNKKITVFWIKWVQFKNNSNNKYRANLGAVIRF